MGHPPLHPPTYTQLPLGLVQLIIILIFIWAACGRMRRTYTYMGTATYTLFPSGSQGSHSPSTEKVAMREIMPAVNFSYMSNYNFIYNLKGCFIYTPTYNLNVQFYGEANV